LVVLYSILLFAKDFAVRAFYLSVLTLPPC
jgi:hypothetical protein